MMPMVWGMICLPLLAMAPAVFAADAGGAAGKPQAGCEAGKIAGVLLPYLQLIQGDIWLEACIWLVEVERKRPICDAF